MDREKRVLQRIRPFSNCFLIFSNLLHPFLLLRFFFFCQLWGTDLRPSASTRIRITGSVPPTISTRPEPSSCVDAWSRAGRTAPSRTSAASFTPLLICTLGNADSAVSEARPPSLYHRWFPSPGSQWGCRRPGGAVFIGAGRPGFLLADAVAMPCISRETWWSPTGVRFHADPPVLSSAFPRPCWRRW